MDRVFKVYLPLVAIVLYFSGFYYVAKYLQFFGITAGYRDLSLEQYAFNSFTVLFRLVSFQGWSQSFLFFGLVIGLIILFSLPNWKLALAPGRGMGRRTYHRTVEILSFEFRAAIASLATFLVMFTLSAQIGISDACNKLRASNKSIMYVGLDKMLFTGGINDPKAGPRQKDFEVKNFSNKLTEVWRTKEYSYAAQTFDSTDCAQPVILFTIPHENFKLAVVTRKAKM